MKKVEKISLRNEDIVVARNLNALAEIDTQSAQKSSKQLQILREDTPNNPDETKYFPNR